MHKEIVILGAGITGLTAAYYLKKAGKDVLVIDKASMPGGVIQTAEENGFIYEMGPNTGVMANMEVVRLFEELSPDCELVIANSKVKKRYVLKDGAWEALPSGLGAAVKTPLFTTGDKFRVLGEPFRGKGKNPHETLAQFVERRLGKSFLDYAIDPFILGVYAGDPGLLVPKYALPKLYNLEQNFGSLIGGTIKKKFKDKTPKEDRPTREVFSAKGGLSSLTVALTKRIGGDNILLGTTVSEIGKDGEGFNLTCTDKNSDTLQIKASRVITTVGAYALSNMMPFISNDLIAKIDSLMYTRVIELAIGFKQWKGIELDAFGGLIPHKEKRDILGIMFMSALLAGRAPEGGALLSVFMGGVRRPDIMDWTDEQVRQVVANELMDLMKMDSFEPDLYKVIRHSYAIPQYEASSGERFNAVEQIEKNNPGLYIGGNLRNGIGMADRILQGKELADGVL